MSSTAQYLSLGIACLTLVFAACANDVQTDPGPNAQGGATSSQGGATSSGSSTTASISTSTTDPGQGGSPMGGGCKPKPGDPPCGACMKANCCDQIIACDADMQCSCFRQCAKMSMGNPEPCFDKCGPPGASLDALDQCRKGKCAGACMMGPGPGGGPPGPGGASSGGGGSSPGGGGGQ